MRSSSSRSWTFSFAPIAGGLIDRHGARRIALFGAPLTGLAIASIALSGPSIWSWYLAWFGFGLFSMFMGPQVWATVISRHFNASRGLALSVGLSGNGLGALVWPPLTVALLALYGWRGAYAGLGATVGIGLTLCCLVLLNGPAAAPREDVAPDPTHAAPPVIGRTLREAVSGSVFWRIAIGMMVIGASVTAILIHLPALLSDKGMSPGAVAAVMAVFAPAVILGRLAGGAILDRVHGRYVMFAMFLTPAAGCMALIGYHGGFAPAIACALLVGVAAGVEGDLLGFLASRYFGLRAFGAIYGGLLSIFVIGFGAAPTLAGWVFDSLGSYDAGLIVLVVVLLVCAPVALTLGRYPYPLHRAEEEAGAARAAEA